MLHVRQNAGCSCNGHEHVAGMFDGARIRMLVRPCQGRSRDQPYSRVDGTGINQWPKLVPPHRGHRLIEVVDQVLPLAPSAVSMVTTTGELNERRFINDVQRSRRWKNLQGLLPVTGALLTRGQRDLAVATGRNGPAWQDPGCCRSPGARSRPQRPGVAA